MSKVLVAFVQDRSGSMQSVWEETLSGFKAFINKLRESAIKDGVEYLFSLTTFDTLIETPITAQPIGEVNLEELAKHGPRGGTALYDAVGATIQNTDSNKHGADKVICVIVTDGEENSSREWSKEKLHAAIDAKLNAGNWTFTYLGTQPETWSDADKIGLAAGAVASYSPLRAKASYAATAQAVACLASSSRMSSRTLMTDFLDKSAADDAGMKTKPPMTASPVPKMPPPVSKSAAKRNWR